MSKEARAAAIAADVEQWWHLKAGEAAEILLDRLIREKIPYGTAA